MTEDLSPMLNLYAKISVIFNSLKKRVTFFIFLSKNTLLSEILCNFAPASAYCGYDVICE